MIRVGTPAEFYIFGSMYSYFAVCYFLCTILAAEVFGPIFRRMEITSTYEYLEKRFSRSVKYQVKLKIWISLLKILKFLINLKNTFEGNHNLRYPNSYVCRNRYLCTSFGSRNSYRLNKVRIFFRKLSTKSPILSML